MAFRRRIDTEAVMIFVAIIVLCVAMCGGTMATAEFVGGHVAGLSEVIP